MPITGRCLCGAITYEIANPPQEWGICHCKNCQRQAGSAFSTLAGVPKSDFRMDGEAKLYEDSDTETGTTVGRYFCGDCGSALYSLVESDPDMLYLKTGTMDDTSTFVPQFQCWCASKQDWVRLEEGIATMERN